MGTPTTDTSKSNEERVIDLICDKCELRREEVTMDKKLGSELGFDSLDAVELIMEVEKEWDVALADEDAEKVVTVRDLVNLLQKNIHKND